MTRQVFIAVFWAAVIGFGGGVGRHAAAFTATLAAQADADEARIRTLVQKLEQLARQGDGSGFLALQAPSADERPANEFVLTEFKPGANRVVLQERDRQPLRGVLPGNGYTLTLDAFVEFGDRARIATWQLDIKRVGDDWLIAGEELMSAVENLYRLSVNPQKQFDAHNFTVVSEDLELTLIDGSVFVVETNQGVTGLVLLGHGEMNFHPSPDSEKGQLRIFAGSEALVSRFDAAFVRLGSYETHADPSVLKPRPVDPRDLRRAEQIFREDSVRSYVVDLSDLTRDTWSILPGDGDFLAEIRTRRFEALTYAKSSVEAEDISFFERRRHRNIAVYASKNKLQSRGRFYNEDDLAPYDVVDYDIDVNLAPDRVWISGRAAMRLRVRAPSINQLTIRLADSLVVRAVTSEQFGRLFSLRITNQNAVLVNLPASVVQDTIFTVTVEYSGRLEPQPPENEGLAPGGQRESAQSRNFDEMFVNRLEAAFLYSHMSYWYPQSPVTDFATATIQIVVPADYSCVASGVQESGSPEMMPAAGGGQSRKVYTFSAIRPLRYLAFLVTKMARADQWTVVFDGDEPRRAAFGKDELPGGWESYKKLDLMVEAQPRLNGRGKTIAERAVDITQFYESIIGDAPYSAFTVALIETPLPGGHSPGYFAILNQPAPNSGLSWRNDPASFSAYPELFLAHEIAHQWWGQAVGWRNYHEQWLSEGFAQYFAALYAQKFRGDDVFESVIRQMRRWAVNESDQGAIYLGYRVGHVKNDGRSFRAIVYNKGAMVLHMLRRLLGDDTFFQGMRRYYANSRFTKAGTESFRAAMENESGRSLERFFERWIYGDALPRVTFGYRVEKGETDSKGSTGSRGSIGSIGSNGSKGSGGSGGSVAVLRFEQTGDIFDFPVTATLQYADRRSVDVIVPVTDKIVEYRVPLDGTLKSVDVNKDDGAVTEILMAR